jgi:hypothetical protein
MDTIPNDLKDYMDTLKDKTTKISMDELKEYLEYMTRSIETMVLGIDYMDKWDRRSQEFGVATMFHVAALKRCDDNDYPLAKMYKEFYKRTCDPNDEANKMIDKLINLRAQDGN